MSGFGSLKTAQGACRGVVCQERKQLCLGESFRLGHGLPPHGPKVYAARWSTLDHKLVRLGHNALHANSTARKYKRHAALCQLSRLLSCLRLAGDGSQFGRCQFVWQGQAQKSLRGDGTRG